MSGGQDAGPEPRAVEPALAISPVGRRRRPSGEPPPLPRRLVASTRWYLVAGAMAAALWSGILFDPVLARVTDADAAVLRLVAELRSDTVTPVMRALDDLGSAWAVRTVGWATIAILVISRRFHHLAAYLIVLACGALLTSTLTTTIGRPRPADIEILASWQGYAHPARPVAATSVVLAGALATLVPQGIWRNRGKWIAALWLAGLCLAQIYLGVAHVSDVAAGLVCGWALPVVAFRLLVPEDAFPITYRGGRRAHLDVGGSRGAAIVTALDQQLGLDVVAVEPFGLGGSAGSTPLRLRVRGADQGPETTLFAKLYAKSHLRSDRWYKLARTVAYGRLEDEKPFSTVRRLVEYEDHLLRLLRDAGLPTPRPYGFVEITPEREYLIVMEFFEDAVELGAHELGDEAIDSGLGVVRRLWQAGVAHRDIKPSNVLVRDAQVLLIDVAFATVRPTPWRQAVDLANMMLTLALSSSAERVYGRALEQFAPDDLAEAFAASRSVTIPTQLRDRLRADPRELLGRFRSLAPARPPIPIQLWTVRRVALTLAVVATVAASMALLVAYAQVAELL